MGDIADMMLSGELCECCGGYIDDEASGIPRYCSKKCAADRSAVQRQAKKPVPQKVAKIHCPACGKRVTEAGIHDHMRSLHPQALHMRSAVAHTAVVKALLELVQATTDYAAYSDTPLTENASTKLANARAALIAAGVKT